MPTLRSALKIGLLASLPCCFAQPAPPPRPVPNYDEAKMPAYSLPPALGNVKRAAEWPARRAELYGIFEREMFGRLGGKLASTIYEPTSGPSPALAGAAVRKEVSILFTGKKDGPRMNLLIYLPPNANGPVPVFLGLNFQGNHTVANDPAVKAVTDKARGAQESRWVVEQVLKRGYATITAHYEDLDPDFDDGFQNGVQPLFYKPGQTRPAADEWGAIGAWAWGLSRAMDYIETDKTLDAKRVVLHGHSRIGKAALWAGASDPRFAIVVSNDSGAGGAALSKRIYGETVGDLNTRFPHWFAKNYAKYSGHEDTMPFDQHMLMALMAPRPLYACSAQEDQWADPKGEFLSLVHADPVYKLLGTPGLPSHEFPPLHTPLMGTLGYHIRAGKHDVTEYDWQRWMDFVDKHFGRK